MAERCSECTDGRGTALGLHGHTWALYFMTSASAKKAWGLTCVTVLWLAVEAMV